MRRGHGAGFSSARYSALVPASPRIARNRARAGVQTTTAPSRRSPEVSTRATMDAGSSPRDCSGQRMRRTPSSPRRSEATASCPKSLSSVSRTRCSRRERAKTSRAVGRPSGSSCSRKRRFEVQPSHRGALSQSTGRYWLARAGKGVLRMRRHKGNTTLGVRA